MKGKLYLVILAFVLSIATVLAFRNVAPANVYKLTGVTYIPTGCALTGTRPCTPPNTGTCKCFYYYTVSVGYVLLADNTPLWIAE